MAFRRQVPVGGQFIADFLALNDSINIAQTTDVIPTPHARARAGSLTKQREDVALKAPYDGYVEKLSVHAPGEVVGAGQVIAEVVPAAPGRSGRLGPARCAAV